MSKQGLTGYPSVDKPWLKYYREEYISSKLPHMTAVQYFEAHTKDLSGEPALDAFDGHYTYEEFKKAYREVAASLCAAGIRKGDICLFVLPPMAVEAVLLYAVNTIGAVLTGLPPQATEQDIIKAIRELQVKKLFIFCDFLTSNAEHEIYVQTNIENIIVLGTPPTWSCDARTMFYQEFITLGAAIPLPTVTVTPEDLLFIARTGGTTGEPKSVMLNSNTFNIVVHQFLNSDLPYAKRDRWLRLWSLFSATAMIANCHLPLVAGMESIVRAFTIDLNDFDKMLLREKCNHLMLIPQLLDALEQSDLIRKEDLSYIKTVGCGGLGITNDFEMRTKDFFIRHNINAFLGYGWGCTENGATAVIRSNSETTRIGTAGIPLSHTIVAAFDPETKEEKRYGEEGELCISSPTMMMGYYGDDALTNEVIKIHPDSLTWLHTGDLGTVDEDGYVTISGRMTRVIFTSTGNKVYPAYLENDISKVDGVREVAVCEMPDPDNAGFFLPVCFIVPDSDRDPNEIQKGVTDFCLQTFADYTQPKHILLKDSLPLTKVGKIDIIALEKEVCGK